MKIGIKPTVDVVFKTVFGSEEHSGVTAEFLNAILEHEGRAKARSLTILNPLRLGQFHGDKDAVLDVRAEDEAGREFQLEVQVRAYADLPRRMIHNWASCYLSRLRKGERYEGLRPVISIWILEGALEREGGWFRSYALRDPKDGTILCADAAILVLELSRWAKEHALEAGPILETELDRWLYFLWKGEELDPEQALGSYSNERIREALETMAVFTKSEAARDLYRRRMEYRMEQASIRAEDREAGMAEGRALGLAEGRVEGRALGLEEGRQEGRQEGRTEGEAEALRAVASRLKREGLDLNLIARTTGLTKEEIEALAR